MAKHKVKAHFSHKGKTYKPGDDFESSDEHEVQTLANQGHIEHPQGQQPQGQSQGQKQGQPGGQGQGQGEDPGKQGR